jgi:hypothetical protein
MGEIEPNRPQPRTVPAEREINCQKRKAPDPTVDRTRGSAPTLVAARTSQPSLGSCPLDQYFSSRISSMRGGLDYGELPAIEEPAPHICCASISVHPSL